MSESVDDIEINQTIARSVVFRGVLPGGNLRYRTQAVSQVVGTRDFSIGSGHSVDADDLYYAIQQFIDSWSDIAEGQVSPELQDAIDNKQVLMRSPNEVLIAPWPLQLQCRGCGCLQRFRENDNQIMQRLVRNLQTIDGRRRVPCPRRCGGYMRQFPHQSIHRCGSARPLEFSHQVARALPAGVRYDNKGSYGNSPFRMIESEESVGNALQSICRACAARNPSADGTMQRGALVGAEQNESFYVHSVQFLSLPSDIARWLRQIQDGAIFTTTPIGLAYWEGALAAICGVVDKPSLLLRLSAMITGSSGDVDSEEEAQKLATAESELADVQANEPESRAKTLLVAMLTEQIQELRSRSGAQTSGFTDDLAVLPRPALDTLSSGQVLQSRRTLEAVLLPGCTKETTVGDRIARASQSMRHVIESERLELLDRYGILEVRHLDGLQVNLASVGFSREIQDPTFLSSGSTPVVLNAFSEQTPSGPLPSVYALSAETEALWFRLAPIRVLQWCADAMEWTVPDAALASEHSARAWLLSRCPALSMTPREIARSDAAPQEMAPFNLLHSILHALLHTAKRHTGYGEGTLSEYLLPSSLSGLIYVGSLQNYTAGGLKSAFIHSLKPWLDEAAQQSMDCIFDPYCTGNGSSCSGCQQLPRGCETFNRGLSRAYLVGGIAGSQGDTVMVNQGFWNAH